MRGMNQATELPSVGGSMRRLICRSAPLPTKHIADQMCQDRDEQEWTMGAPPDWAPSNIWSPIRRRVVAEPKDTDNGQCWSEEIFSLL